MPSRFVKNISESDVLHKSVKNIKNLLISATIKQFPCEVGCYLQWNDKTVHYKRKLEKEGGRTKFVGKNPMRQKVLEWEQEIKSADGSDENEIFPLVLYLSSARLWNENRTDEMDKLLSRTDAYQRCLDKTKQSISV